MTKVKDISAMLAHYGLKLSNKLNAIYAWPDLEIDPFVLLKRMSLVDAASMMDILPETRCNMTEFCYECAKVAAAELKSAGSCIHASDWAVLDKCISLVEPFDDVKSQLREIGSRYKDESKEKYFVGVVNQINESRREVPMYPAGIAAAFTMEVLIGSGVSRLDADTRITGILTESLQNMLKPSMEAHQALNG